MRFNRVHSSTNCLLVINPPFLISDTSSTAANIARSGFCSKSWASTFCHHGTGQCGGAVDEAAVDEGAVRPWVTAGGGRCGGVEDAADAGALFGLGEAVVAS
ncbi:hypothetical protein GE21DRAFT_1053922 [Neurospora crassa]|nr:hypothetical protein GE21DRAFT_1053922 [Neurospora crassa]